MATFRCNCGCIKNDVKDELIGKKARCNNCNKIVIIESSHSDKHNNTITINTQVDLYSKNTDETDCEKNNCDVKTEVFCNILSNDETEIFSYELSKIHKRYEIYNLIDASKMPSAHKKIVNARKSFGIPNDEEIIYLCDATVFGSCKVGFAICGSGIYWVKNKITWHELSKRKIYLLHDNCIYFGPDMGGIDTHILGREKCEDLIKLLAEVRDKAGGYLSDFNQDDFLFAAHTKFRSLLTERGLGGPILTKVTRLQADLVWLKFVRDLVCARVRYTVEWSVRQSPRTFHEFWDFQRFLNPDTPWFIAGIKRGSGGPEEPVATAPKADTD